MGYGGTGQGAQDLRPGTDLRLLTYQLAACRQSSFLPVGNWLSVILFLKSQTRWVVSSPEPTKNASGDLKMVDVGSGEGGAWNQIPIWEGKNPADSSPTYLVCNPEPVFSLSVAQ